MTKKTITFDIPGPDPDQEPTNEIRANRIDQLRKVYNAVIGEHHTDEADEYELANIFTDIRHWCDRKNIDVYRVLDLSYQHYLEERTTPTLSLVEQSL